MTNLLQNDCFVPFKFQIPIYNWFYPMSYNEIACSQDNIDKIFSAERIERVKNRSLYFHIPFCQDICAFCPFYREVLKSDEYLDKYVDALVSEIYMKSKYKYVSDVPITSIFFGGGTPSILQPRHIRKIGKAIHDCFNLSELKEWSFEMNAKTVKPEKTEALREIGVTHGRMGVQTFNPEYRKIFKLTATLENIYEGAELLNKSFPNVCIDMLYGMHGQTIDDLVRDLKCATELQTSHMDVYPINNGVVQKRLLDEYQEKNLKVTSGLSKYVFNSVVFEYLSANGFYPHNGHGYIRTKQMGKDFVTDEYTFQYHETVYGYSNHELIAFGPVGYSVLNEYVMENVPNIKTYIESVQKKELPIVGCASYPRKMTEIKGIVLHLPYHGVAYKDKIDANYIDVELNDKLKTLIENKMVIEHKDRYALTKLGWLNYVNLLYFLSPHEEQSVLNKFMESAGVYKDFISSLDF